MRASLVFAIAAVLAGSTPLSAHRLDEYLQATRLSVEGDAIVVEMDLTAGANVAADIAARIDTDDDERISPTEAADYAGTVLADVSLSVNGADIPIRLTRVEAPAIGEMREGMGTLRLTAIGQLATAPGHRLRLRYRNDHRAEIGVYLVNAMAPQNASVDLTSQERDPHQREIRLEYTVSPLGQARIGWLAFAFLLLSSLFCLRSRVWPVADIVRGRQSIRMTDLR